MIYIGSRRKIQKTLYRLLSMRNKYPLLLYVKLICIKILLHCEYKKPTIGALWSKTQFMAKIASYIGIDYNINNLGNVYSESGDNLGLIKNIEYQDIEYSKKLFGLTNQFEGYITSGGTEGNLFLVWLGREKLKRKGKQKIVLLLTKFTHYSIKKAANILAVDIEYIPYSNIDYTLDYKRLSLSVQKLYSKGFRSFMLPVTLGYSSTGSIDNMREIKSVIERIKKSRKDICFYLWVDAAMQGLPLMFLDQKINKFNFNNVNGIIIDYHKLAGTPIPSGVVMYKRNLRNLIESDIDYLYEKDNTILGSRPGFSAMAIYSYINSYPEDKKRMYFFKLVRQKNEFIDLLKNAVPGVRVVNSDNSLTFAIFIDKVFKRLPHDVEDKFALNVCSIDGIDHYKIHVASLNFLMYGMQLIDELHKIYNVLSDYPRVINPRL